MEFVWPDVADDRRPNAVAGAVRAHEPENAAVVRLQHVAVTVEFHIPRICRRRGPPSAVAHDIFPDGSGVAKHVAAEVVAAVDIGKRAILPIAGDEHDVWTCQVRREGAMKEPLSAG